MSGGPTLHSAAAGNGYRLYARRAAACALVVLVAVLSLEAVQSRWKIAYDQSEHACLDPYRFFLVTLGRVVPSAGDIVTFKTRGVPLFSDGTHFTKKVMATEGAVVRAERDGVWVDGVWLPYTQNAVDRLAEAGVSPAAERADTYVVGPGQAFVIGTNPRSYDSRYYGPIEIDQIMGQARPLW